MNTLDTVLSRFPDYECVIGIDHQGFKDYIESKFEPWMNWGNRLSSYEHHYDPYKYWVLDHINPIKSATTEDDMIQLSHYTNIQPICSFINVRIKRSILNYYELEKWNQIGYTNINNICYYNNLEIGIASSDLEILKVWEIHRVKEYVRKTS